ncbi:hypothetical protein DFH09DRAFT_1026188 [Mycena vulgaris]|nr:hypothetical protein DFH09DRAFT_1026188 [Mycena vulgaris]
MMSETFRLFDLPPELLVHILGFLPLETLYACQQSSRFFYNFIAASIELQYLMATSVAQVTENPSAPLPASDRLAMLRAREKAFEDFDPSWVRSIPVTFSPSGLYEVSAGFFFLGEHQRQALRYMQLPSDRNEPRVQWGRIPVPSIKSVIIDFCLAIEEHDLVVMATFTPTGRITEGIPEGLINLEFLTMSDTHMRHPKAQGPVEVRTSRWGVPNVIIEVVGDYMVFVESYARWVDDHPQDRVYVYEWMTGKLVMKIDAESGSYFGAVFLSPGVLLLPNTVTATLELWHIPSEQTTPSLTLHLPRLVPGERIRIISARGEPNPSVYSLGKPPRLPFSPSAEDSIIVFHINFIARRFVLFIHRRALLALLDEHAPGDTSNYADWGPEVCRWLSAGGMIMDWITTTSGQRCVLLPERGPAPIYILDFNPYHTRDPDHCLAPTDDPFADHGIWAEAVASRLKCRMSSSTAHFAIYHGVSLDEERVIALRRNPTRQVSGVDVFYFG